jgi:hypothetical protein
MALIKEIQMIVSPNGDGIMIDMTTNKLWYVGMHGDKLEEVSDADEFIKDMKDFIRIYDEEKKNRTSF